MGVYIYPCRGCPLREGCQQRDEFRARAQNIGAMSVKFRCERLASEMRPGRRVVVTMPRARDCSSYYEPNIQIWHEEVAATISGGHGYYQFSCITDPGTADPYMDEIGVTSDDLAAVDKYRFRRGRPHTRIKRFLDEPDRKFCDLGSLLLPGGGCDKPAGEPCQCKEIEPLVQAVGDQP